MKALYLLFGLLLLTTIGIAPPTPFLVDGWVQYSNGDPVNNPEVNLTNLNTGEVFTAEISTNCYQILPVNISTGDVVRFDFTDGITYNITNHTVTAYDLNSGGIFDFALTLISTSSGITGFSPDSPVHDVENATRTFSITIDQMVDVIWFIDGTNIQTDMGVTQASYTNTNATPGIWNVSAIVSNENAATKTWIWEVTPFDTVELTKQSTAPFMICGQVFDENDTECIYPVVNISNLNINIGWTALTLNDSHYYQLLIDTANISTGDVIRINASKDCVIWSADHTIVKDDINNSMIEVNINKEEVLPDLIVTQILPPQDQEWLIANSNNTITAEIKNDGTAITSEFDVSLTANGYLIDIITVTSITGDTKSVTFNWVPEIDANYLLVVEADSNNNINESNETNNNLSIRVDVGEPDFVVTAIEFDPSSPVNDSDPANVTATINNMGSVGAWVDVDFSIAEKCGDEYFPIDDFASIIYIEAHGVNTTSAVWNATCGWCSNEYEIKVAAGDSSRIADLTVIPSRDFTVTNITSSSRTAKFGDNVSFNITLENLGVRAGDTAIDISIDNGRDSELIYSTSRTLYPKIPDYIVFDWDIGSTNLGGDCNISVLVDPYRKTSEINETNNVMMWPIFVNGTDLVVTDVSLTAGDENPYLYGKEDLFNVATIIENRGAIPANNFTIRFEHNGFSNEINGMSLTAGEICTIYTEWDLSNATTGNQQVLVVTIDEHNNPENNLTNNVKNLSREGKSPWDIIDISFDPEYPKEGDNVNVTVHLENNGLRSETADVRFCVNGHEFEKKDVYVDANAVTEVSVTLKDVRALLLKPCEIKSKYDIRVFEARDPGNTEDEKSMPIDIPENMIVRMSVDSPAIYKDTANVYINITNNGDNVANTTLWFYDVDNTYYNLSGSEGDVTYEYPDASDMSVRFDDTKLRQDTPYNGSCKVIDEDGEIIHNPPPFNTTTWLKNDWITWVSGDIITIEYKDLKGTAGLPGPRFMSAALLNTTPINLNPGESTNLTIPWYVPLGGHMLWAQVSSESDHKLVNSQTPDITVTLSVNNEVDDGDLLNVTATLKNDGSPDVTDFEISFFNDSNKFNVTKIPGIAVSGGNVTNVSVWWEANTWNASKGVATLNHTIHARIDPCENIDAYEGNNHDATVVKVNPTRDFSVTDMLFAQDEKTEPITINATIKNFGKAGSTNISICINDSCRHLQIYSANHWVGSESYVNITCNASVVGNCMINITADPDNRVLEINESNNNMMLPVYIEAPDLTVNSLIIDPDDLIEGDTANITAIIANIGERDANNVTVAFYDRGNHIQSGDWRLNGGGSLTITQPNAAGLRIHFKKLEIFSGTSLHIYDESENPVINMMRVRRSNVWTEWISGSSAIIDINGSSSCFAEIDKYEYHKIFNITDLSLEANTSKEIRTKWTAYPSGSHEISIIVDPDDVIIELNETNNEKACFNVVQGPDLRVDLILNNTNPVEGDIINITGCIKNIGVLPANDFTVRIDIDDTCTEFANVSLLRNETLNISMPWTATIGNHIIQVAADPDELIFETSEENNVDSINVFVNSPDLNVTNVELNPVNPVDEDELWINTTIANQGFQRANNFFADVFYEYNELEGTLEPFESYEVDGVNSWVNLTWKNKTADAGCIYIYLEEVRGSPMLRIYDGNNTLVTNTTTSRWIAVMGNAANISVHADKPGNWNSIKMRFYAGNMTRFNDLSLDVNESVTLYMKQEVSTGKHDIRVFADIESHLNENNKENNIRTGTINVQPSRDFSISSICVSANGYEIDSNNTIQDGDPVIVSATIENTGFRMGIVDVDIIDEHNWIDASPRLELTSNGYAQVIRYPEADAIRVHFKELDVSPGGIVEIRDRNGTLLCTLSSYTPTSPWLDKNEIYVYNVCIYKYSTYEIDKYQYRKINRTTKTVAANGTVHITVRFTPDAGNHTIHVIADPADEIGEIIESNNQANETIYVEPCRDPAVVDITFSNELPDPGTAVNITANVTNNGNITTTFTVDLYATKFEYHPCASRHPPEHPIQSDYYNVLFEKEINSYPEANWTGVHFTKISTIDGMGRTYLHVSDRNGTMSENHYGRPEVEDVWTWVSGDIMKIKTKLFCNYWTSVWGFDIDTVAHIVTLNQTTVTLKPGKTASVTGTLPNVRIGNRSIEYTITAVVDQDNIVFETDEFNNKISKELAANCPDMTVCDYLRFDSGKTSAVIENIGTGKAEDTIVRFARDVEFSGDEKYGMKISALDVDNDEEDDEDYVDAIRVHFKKLHIEGTDSLRIRKTYSSEILQSYGSGDYYDIWSNWISGDDFKIYYDRDVDVDVDRYEYAKDETVGDISGDNIKKMEIPWTKYEAPYNLTIYADFGNDSIESNEDNNYEKIRMGADITLERHIIPDYLQVNKPLNFIVRIENRGTMSVPPFNVTMYAKPENGTMIPVENYIIEKLEPNADCNIKFKWKPPIDGKYRFIIRVDPEDGIVELNEDNNDLILYDMRIFRHLGYGGRSLETYDKDEVNGGFIFKMGDRDGEGDPEQWYQGFFRKGDTYKAKWNISLPANANIKIARLYLYWGFTKGYTQPTEFKLKFNDNEYSLAQDPAYPHYSDYPIEEGIEEKYNYASGVYCYDVKDHFTGIDEATVTVHNLHGAEYTCIAGASLVIVYESDSGVLTKYWINEGADLLGCGSDFSSLEPDDCTTEVFFNGDIDFDRLSNASLTTVVPFGSSGGDLVDETSLGDTIWADKKRNGLYLNGEELKDGAWICNVNLDSVGIDKRDVEDHLLIRDNEVGIQDRGDYTMTSANAFLVLRYPPDLAVTDIAAPVSAVVGKKYAINTIISNEGRSNAIDFNVTFYSNGMKIGRQKISLDSGENMTLQFNWKPMYMGKIYTLKAEADELSGPNWVELDFDNNVMEKNVPIVGAGFGNESGPMGAGGEGIGGDGKGSGTSLLDAITGYLMKGTVLGGKESGGGGGMGEYSLLGWVMKFAVVTAGFLVVYTGYMGERQKYKKRK